MITALLAATLVAGPPPAVEPTEKHPIVVGEERISRGWLRHWTDIVVRAAGGPRDAHRGEAARYLIMAHWIRGEAAERGVAATRDEVWRAFRRQRRKASPRGRGYRRFLRETGQTGNDLRYRVRTDLLSDKLRAQVTDGLETAEEQQEALSDFIVAYDRKWRARTICRAPWAIEFACGTTSSGRTVSAPGRELFPDVDRIAAGTR